MHHRRRFHLQWWARSLSALQLAILIGICFVHRVVPNHLGLRRVLIRLLSKLGY